MRLVFLLTLVVFPGLAAAQLKNGPVDLDGRVDARPLPLQRVRWQDGTIWVPTRYAREALGWEVERFAPQGPVRICREEFCVVAPPDILSDDGLELNLDQAVELTALQVKLRVVTEGQPLRLELISRPGPTGEIVKGELAVGDLVPDLHFNGVNGPGRRLGSFLGRKLLILNWASW